MKNDSYVDLSDDDTIYPDDFDPDGFEEFDLAVDAAELEYNEGTYLDPNESFRSALIHENRTHSFFNSILQFSNGSFLEGLKAYARGNREYSPKKVEVFAFTDWQNYAPRKCNIPDNSGNKQCIHSIDLNDPGIALSKAKSFEEANTMHIRHTDLVLNLLRHFWILPEDFYCRHVLAFIAGRAAFWNWEVSNKLSDIENVPDSAYLWWQRYVAYPKADGLIKCGLLVRANLLPPQFSLSELLALFIRRQRIQVHLNIRRGDLGFWELTPEGIEIAGTLGLLEDPEKVKEHIEGNVTSNLRGGRNIELVRKSCKPSESNFSKRLTDNMKMLTWEELRLEVDEDIIRVWAQGKNYDLTYDDLGIGRGVRKGTPSKAKRLLMLIAAYTQEYSKSKKLYSPLDDTRYAGSHGRSVFSTDLSRLNTMLKNTFRLKDNPILIDKDDAVHTLFEIRVLNGNIDEEDTIGNVRIRSEIGSANKRKILSDIKEAERLNVSKISKEKNKH